MNNKVSFIHKYNIMPSLVWRRNNKARGKTSYVPSNENAKLMITIERFATDTQYYRDYYCETILHCHL